MKISALLTSAGINIALCVVLLSLYSVLRKQPGNAHVYFGRRLAKEHGRHRSTSSLERLVPSPGWIKKAWDCTEGDILSAAGVDAVAFIRMIVFSIRIFSIASLICVFIVLPSNYFGQEGPHRRIPSESLDAFTIANVKEGSRWVWIHCLALYIITFSACILLYFEFKNITRMRLYHFAESPRSPSRFTVLVRAIPRCSKASFSENVKDFFTKYHAASYLSHQMIHRTGSVLKLMQNAEKVCEKIGCIADSKLQENCRPIRSRCFLCGGTTNSFQIYHNIDTDVKDQRVDPTESRLAAKECAAAFVFFKTRYAALVACEILQSSNPMLWVTDLAPEPHDVYWSNLAIPYRQLWIRRIATLLAAFCFMIIFLFPVVSVQGLTEMETLQKKFPFLKGILKKTFAIQLVTGYLPSVILMLFLYTVPPIMMFLSSVEGPISRSGRKKSACCKILYFNIWNVFFANVFSGTVITTLVVFFNPRDIPTELAKAVPRQATFFITYVLTSGWASLSSEVMQLFPLVYNFILRDVLRREIDTDYVPSFPYHTEVPRVLIFGLLGFTCSVLAPLILPFLLVYFFLGYIVYKNQMLNVYYPKYDTGGQIWPIVHNTTIFSMVLAQIIAGGVFGLKESPTATGFIIPLVIFTLLFNEYCRNRFHPIFDNISAQDVIELDKLDEQSGQMEQMHMQLQSAYCQAQFDKNEDEEVGAGNRRGGQVKDCDVRKNQSQQTTSGELATCELQEAVPSLSAVIAHLQGSDSTV